MASYASPVSSAGLRREIHARQHARAAAASRFEETFGASPSIVHAPEDKGHGNFHPAAWARIQAHPAWAERLTKRYTADARLPRAHDRWRGELECANSSDALLMNIFCYPRVLARPGVCSLLGIDRGLRPAFGVRAGLLMQREEVDRTELDMQLGDLAVEAKLTEFGFVTAPRERVLRYRRVSEVFSVDDLPWTPRGLQGYQLLRGVLAADQTGGRFLLLCDARRADLQEVWFRVLRAVASCDLRSRLALLSWQELASALPAPLQQFLAAKYGIAP